MDTISLWPCCCRFASTKGGKSSNQIQGRSYLHSCPSCAYSKWLWLPTKVGDPQRGLECLMFFFFLMNFLSFYGSCVVDIIVKKKKKI